MVSAECQSVIDAAFNRFVTDNQNSIEATLIKGVYATNLHPRVIQGEISEDEALLEFLTNFSDRENNGRIHRDEWSAYFAKTAERIGNDSHFCQLMAQMCRL